MRVLIVTHYYPPEPQKLLSDLAESLSALGCDVEVLTGFPNYPHGRIYPEYKMTFCQKELRNGIPVTRVAVFPDHSRSKIKRALNYLSFALTASIVGVTRISRPDVVFVLHPPLSSALVGWVLKKRWNVPVVLNIQDMWPETLSATRLVTQRLLLRMISSFAKWSYKASSAIAVISPGFRANLIEKGVPPSKVAYVPNWVDTDHYRTVPTDSDRAKQMGLAGRFNVMFAGIMGPAQGLSTVIDAAARLKGQHDIQFVLVGDGVESDDLRKRAKDLQLDNVLFLGRHPEHDMPGLFAHADVLLVHLKDDALFRITIPHKILAYMASERPILAAVEGDAASLVSSVHAGLTCKSGDPEALADAVLQMRSLPAQELQTMGRNGRRAAMTQFRRESVAEQMVQLFREVSGRWRAES